MDSRSRCQGLSKRNSRVERRTCGHKPSKIHLSLRFLLFGLLLLFVARHCVLGLYDLADLTRVLLLLCSKTANVRSCTIPDHRRTLAKYLYAPRQQTPSAPTVPTARSACSLAFRADTRRYSDSLLGIGRGADAAIVTGDIVKPESMYASGLQVKWRRVKSTMAPASRTLIHPHSPLPIPEPRGRTPVHPLVHTLRFTVPAPQTMTSISIRGNKMEIETRTHRHRHHQRHHHPASGMSKPSSRIFALTLVIVCAGVVVVLAVGLGIAPTR